MLIEDLGSFQRIGGHVFMFRMCIPKRRHVTASQPPSAAATASDRKHRREPTRDTILSTEEISDTTFTQTSASKDNHSKDSQVSTTSTSSLPGIRELLLDGPIIYRYRELAKATDNFSESRRVGNSVFRAWVRGADVAIVQKKGSFVGNYMELIKIICSVHHISLVKVLGACFRESEYVYLCYEYEEGATLREALQSSKAAGFSVLSKWTSRLQVALDVALGLEYLHDHTMPSFVHKHIKSTNIIVTSDLRGKIAMFGIPQLTGEIPSTSETEAGGGDGGGERKLVRSNSVKITGTPGYMAPEYMANGIITPKIDVFAYGVVLLELLSGQQSGVQYDATGKNFKIVSLTQTVQDIMKDREPQKKLRLWMDPKLKDSYPLDCVFSVAVLAKQCIETDPARRPPMKNVTAKLSKYLDTSLEWEKSLATFSEIQSQTMEGR